MIYDIALFLLLIFVAVTAIFVAKKFFCDEPAEASAVTVNVTSNEPVTAIDEPRGTVSRTQNKQSLLLPLLGIGAAAFLITQNQEAISQVFISKTSAPISAESAKQTITPGVFEGHQVVDGVNWFKIVATSSEGIPFEGWINEMAIHKSPPQENKAADALMKKLGLPTNKERIESIKSLQQVGSALKDSLRIKSETNN